MKRQKIRKLALLAMAFGLTLPSAAYAEDTGKDADPAGAAYSVTGDDSASFSKYLVMKKDAYVPNVTFTFDIAPWTGSIPEDNSRSYYLRSGSDPSVTGTPRLVGDNQKPASGSQPGDQESAHPESQGSVTFSPDDPTTAEDAVDSSKDTISFVTAEDKSDEKAARHTVKLDFSSVTFTEPGIYRYVVTENAVSRPGITSDDTLTRNLDVYVVNDESGGLAVSTYILHTGDDVPLKGISYDGRKKMYTGEALPDKSTGFTNRYESYDLTFRKNVGGNMGSKDKYFWILLRARNKDVDKNDRFVWDISGMEAAPQKNSSTKWSTTQMAVNAGRAAADGSRYITGMDLRNGMVFFVKDGQQVTLRGVTKGLEYEASEKPEGYLMTTGITKENSGNGKEYPDSSAGFMTKDIYTGFYNHLDGVIPTGVLMKIFPFAMLCLAAAAGMAALFFRRKHETV